MGVRIFETFLKKSGYVFTRWLSRIPFQGCLFERRPLHARLCTIPKTWNHLHWRTSRRVSFPHSPNFDNNLPSIKGHRKQKHYPPRWPVHRGQLRLAHPHHLRQRIRALRPPRLRQAPSIPRSRRPRNARVSTPIESRQI